MMKPIRIDFIKQSEQNYDTVGNYGETEHEIWFEITELSDPLYSVAILLHELHEFYRNKDLGTTIEEIDKFDMVDHPELEEPGDDPRAPYHKQHLEASVIERACLAMAGRSWSDYEQEIENLFE